MSGTASPSMFVIYGSADAEFARRLTLFLEVGCDVRSLGGGGMGSPEELFDKIEEGLNANVLILVLTEASSPERWPLERWERLLIEETRHQQVGLALVLLRSCHFPARLKRGNCFDATVDSQRALRQLKRWLQRRALAPGESYSREWSADLEDLYAALSDRCSSLRVPGSLAERFVREAEHDFAGTLWCYCHGRTLGQTVGEAGKQLGLDLPGTVDQNCASIRDWLHDRRFLLVLDAPRQEHLDALLREDGRTSTLLTSEPVRTLATPTTIAFARKLMGERRFAEAYELYYQLIDTGTDKADCARDLIWICEQWDRLEEAASLRPDAYGPGEQLPLFW